MNCSRQGFHVVTLPLVFGVGATKPLVTRLGFVMARIFFFSCFIACDLVVEQVCVTCLR